MSRQDEYYERVAEATLSGGLSEHEARQVALGAMGDCNRADLPVEWAKLNRQWRAIVAELYPGRESEAHEGLKKKHGVESFTQLTVGQIQGSIDRLNARRVNK